MNMKEKNFVSSVVYIRNDESTISDFLETLYEVLEKNFNKFEIICVNDASTDRSKEFIKKHVRSGSDSMLSIVNMSYYQGLEATMCAGIDLAIGDFVFEFDYPVINFKPELIMDIYNHTMKGYDIVSCGSGYSRVYSKLFYKIYNRFSGTQHKLRSETFRIISRRAINRVQSMSVNMPYRKALYANCGLSHDYIEYEPLSNSKTFQTLKKPHDTAISSLMLFTNIFFGITLALTVVMMLLMIGTATYALTIYLTGNPMEGFTTTILIMSGSFFAVFAILAAMIKYLSLILRLVFFKQKYLIQSIEKITG